MKRVLGVISQSVEKRLAPAASPMPSGSDYKIYIGEATTVAELARQSQMDAGAMTRLLDRLETKGLLRRVRATEDRRVVQLELTPEGQQLASEVPAVLAEVMNAHLAGFSKTEWQALRATCAACSPMRKACGTPSQQHTASQGFFSPICLPKQSNI